MKKLIFVFASVVAFTVTANAQDKKAAPAPKQEVATQDESQKAIASDLNMKAAAKYDLSKMVEVLTLTPEQTNAFYQLFERKHQMLNSPEGKKPEAKEHISRIFEEKIRASLTPEQLTKLDANPTLLKYLTH